MTPAQRIQEAIAFPFLNVKSKKGKLLSAQETAKLALAGSIDREKALQEVLERHFG